MAGKGFKDDIPAADNTHQFPVFDYRNTADGPVYKALTDIGKVIIGIKSNDFRYHKIADCFTFAQIVGIRDYLISDPQNILFCNDAH